MARKYEADAERFKARLDQAGINHSAHEISHTMDISMSHAANMLTGRKGFTSPMQTKLDALIAAKEKNWGQYNDSLDEADDSIEPSREQFEVDLQEPQPMPRRTKYQVIKVFDGYAVVENPIAVFRGLSWAEEYAHWLNDQINRGKEGG